MTFASGITNRVRFYHLAIIYALLTFIASIQCYYGYILPAGNAGKLYHNYNNYILFKNSFFHLIHGHDLYKYYLDEQWDLYKYSPTFSLLFSPVALLPDFVGLFLWNLSNAFPLLVGFFQLPQTTTRARAFISVFCVLDLLNNMQNAQANGLMTALIILTFTCLEKRKYFLATFCVVFSIFIKIYGGIAIVLFLFYPDKRKSFLFTLFWILLFAALPLMIVTPDHLMYLYKNWAQLMKVDMANSTGISVMGILKTWFNQKIPDYIVELTGLILLLIPLLQTSKFKLYPFKLMALCYILVFSVIFNHKAESATYIIAVSGIAIWFFCFERTTLGYIMILLTFLFTSLANGDQFPAPVRNFIQSHDLKALIPVVIFIMILVKLLSAKIKIDQPFNTYKL